MSSVRCNLWNPFFSLGILEISLAGFFLFCVFFIFLTQGLALLPMLEYSGTVMAHCSLDLLGPSDPSTSLFQATGTTGTCHHTWLFFFNLYFVEMGSSYVTQAGLELLGSSSLPTSASQSAGIARVSHCSQPNLVVI
uniref:Macaca fascicularis brain cDNA clone: QtrA-19068, similar to human chromosome 18 open reading frame 9 (C18orf9), mRNA, RefSeq: NM_024899.2 n=1 Tax=Macaca fascicularis TaxID=9541 RepID=I7GPP0_MACFA|nr:unnamed protein product [Macaca fascicularis]